MNLPTRARADWTRSRRLLRLGLVSTGLLAVLPAVAQPSFDQSLLSGLVGREVQTAVYTVNFQSLGALAPIVAAAGPNQTYDFSALTFDLPLGSAYEVLASAAGTPGAGDDAFDGANWVQRQQTGGEFYAYYDLRSDGFFLLGSVFVQATDTDGNGVLDQTVQKNAPPDPTYRFPLTDGTAWSQELVSTTEAFGTVTNGNIAVDFLVDGWGTLITPAGSAPAVRLRKTLTVSGDGIQPYTTTSYIFIAEGPIGASIILDGQGNVLTAAHSVNMTPTAVEETPHAAFRLAANYPNPFRDATRIAFDLERPGYVTLRVFDLTGREVAGLIDEPMSRGPHAAEFRADGLPSGVYLYRLQVDGTGSTRPLVVRR